MAELTEFSIAIRLFLKAYPWRRIDPVPRTPLAKPLAECTVALVSSAGFVAPGQDRFSDSARGGDSSFRPIPGDVEVADLCEHHTSDSFDHSGIRQDPNLALPIERIRELAQGGRIGRVAPRHLSLMGSITATGQLVRQTAPQAARWLVADGVDVALLVPV